MESNARVTEALRLQELHSLSVLDTAAEQAYDDVVKLAAFICDAPIAMISLVDEDRQWFKARQGINVMETPRGQALCAHAIMEPHALMEVPNALQDPRFVNNPLVTGEMGLRFYAGVPLLMPSGAALGTVCVVDRVPRKLTQAQADALKALSRQVVQLLALRRVNSELQLLTEAQRLRQREMEAMQTQLKVLNEELAEQTLTDPLTGLKNRRSFDRLLAAEHDRCHRSRTRLALLMVDVDHFKAYNDQYGHQAGDLALQQVARTIQSESRSYDHVARYGGEEFSVILPSTDIGEAHVVAERIRAAVQALTGLHRLVTVSVGVAINKEADTPEELVRRADQALYQAKQAGRNRVATLL